MPNGPKTLRITDTRKVSGATGLPINTPRSGDYDYEVVSNIIKAAKDEGVDPYTAIAIGLQESGLGTVEDAELNVGQVHLGKLRSNKDRFVAHEKSIANSKDEVYSGARSLAFMLRESAADADKAGYSKGNEAQRLQAYNGYGKVGANNDVGAKMLYGIDLTKHTIDMSKTPLYGKTIIDLRDNIIKQNPEISELIEAYNLPAEEMSGVTIATEKTPAGKIKYTFKKDNTLVGEFEDDENNLRTEGARGGYLRNLYLKSKKQKTASTVANIQKVIQRT